MDSLIRTINKIQDQFRSLKEDPIALPQIVVVGSQSAGKSSVLESLVQRSFLPRGTGIVTRCPLILQLLHCPANDVRRKGVPYNEWGEFQHAEGKVFPMDKIRDEIDRRTEELAGASRNISPTPITLRVYSPNVLTLTLVDLPGMTQVPILGQPADIGKQIRDLIDSYIKQKLSIILAVVTANTDMSTNESLKIAKEADPAGERTLAVVTKLDLMDKGTNATDILTGKLIPVKLGIIGVVNRSQKDIMDKKSIKTALEAEESFLNKHYPQLASKNGSLFLAKALQDLLTRHIKSSLPAIEKKFSARVEGCLAELEECGKAVSDEQETLTNIISEFTKTFNSKLNGEWVDIRSPILIGGSKCSHIFDQLKMQFDSVKPCSSYCLEEVIMAIKNTNGPRPPFILSEPAFEALVKPLIMKMKQPSLDCASAVMEELENVCRESIPKATSTRFPRLKEEITKLVGVMIEEYSVKAKELIREIVAIELGHITYSHFDAFKGSGMQKILSMNLKSYCAPDHPENGGQWPFKSDPEFVKELENRCSAKRARFDESLLMPTLQDKKHVMLLGEMLDLYYGAVSIRMQDSVAKTIMTYLVNTIKNDLQTKLTLRLFSVIGTLFQEEESVTYRRTEKEKELQALQNSIRELNGIRENY